MGGTERIGVQTAWCRVAQSIDNTGVILQGFTSPLCCVCAVSTVQSCMKIWSWFGAASQWSGDFLIVKSGRNEV